MTQHEMELQEKAQLEVLKELLACIPNDAKSRIQAENERIMFDRDKFTADEAKNLIAIVINYQNQQIGKFEKSFKRIEKEIKELRQLDLYRQGGGET